MKKIILCLAILLSFSATKLLAQNNGQQMQQAWQSYLKDSVKLSDAMSDSVLAIRMQYRPQMRDIFTDQSSSAADKQTKMQNLRTDMDVRYKAAGLTDDQIQTIHKHEDDMRARMMNRNNGGGGQ
jgi:hypothetical protein